MDEERSPAFTILLVDDDADMRIYLKRCLKRLPLPVVRVLEAADGIEALARARDARVDLIISDVVMPRMGGLTLCEKLRDDPTLPAMTILLITGELSSYEVRERAEREFPIEILTKPFNAQKLCTTVMGILDPRPPTHTAAPD